MDIKASVFSSIVKNAALSLVEFNTWPLLNEFTAYSMNGNGSPMLVRPDGFIRIHEKETDGGLSEHAFFLEVDRSTETQESLVTRAGCYLDHYRSGGFAEKCGGLRSAFRDYPFRVLMVFKTAERRNNTAERLIQASPPILSQVWLTTHTEITTDPFGPVWLRPVDYRDALGNSPFEQNLRLSRPTYERQSAREDWIERAVKKLCLIVPETK